MLGFEKFGDITETLVFLKLFQPKNFNRQDPITYIFLISFLIFVLGIIFFASLKVLAAIGLLFLTVILAGPIWMMYKKF